MYIIKDVTKRFFTSLRDGKAELFSKGHDVIAGWQVKLEVVGVAANGFFYFAIVEGAGVVAGEFGRYHGGPFGFGRLTAY